MSTTYPSTLHHKTVVSYDNYKKCLHNYMAYGRVGQRKVIRLYGFRVQNKTRFMDSFQVV